MHSNVPLVRAALVPLAFVAVAGMHLQAQELEPHWWMPDDDVYTIMADPANDRVYLGGTFDYVGPAAPYGGVWSLATGEGDSQWPAPNGRVDAVIPDGSGGWYVGGAFTRMGDQARHGLAHLSSNGTVLPGFANTGFATTGPNTLVRALERKGDTLFVGGLFDGVGEFRPGSARVDTLTGSNAGAFPRVDGAVYAIVGDGAGGWVIGGDFTAVDGEPRQNIARVNADGSLHPWAPTHQGYIQDLQRSGATLYVGGYFEWVGNVERENLAAFDLGSGALMDWAPRANGVVYTLALHGGAVLVGGSFTTVNDVPRTNIAAVDALTGEPTPWAPDADDRVVRIRHQGGQIYAAGHFSNIGQAPRTYLAELDAGTGLALPWSPTVVGAVGDMDITGNTMYFAGSVTSVGGLPRNRLAAVDLLTGDPVAWAPVSDVISSGHSRVRATPGRIYVAEPFTMIGGVPRSAIAALDPVTGATLPWAVDPGGGNVFAIEPVAGEVLLGGEFTAVHTAARAHLAAIRLSTSEWITAMPASDLPNGVHALAQGLGQLFVGGDFTTLGGVIHSRLASIDLNTLTLSGWDPNVNATVRDLHVDGTTLYVAGLFTQVSGVNRDRLAAFSLPGNTLLPWNPAANDDVFCIDVADGTAYVGGTFTTAGGQPRNLLAALSTSTGLATAWAPDAGTGAQAVNTVKVKDDELLVGGSFTTLAGSARRFLGAVDRTSGALSPVQGSCNGEVSVIAVQGDTVYAGGRFTSLGGVERSGIACLDANTGRPTAFAPAAGGGLTSAAVRCFAMRSDTLYIGGEFTTVNAITRNRLAAVNASTGDLLAWDPNASAIVHALLIHGDTLFAGGNFTTIGGQGIARLAALNAETGVPHAAWAPAPNQQVHTLLWHDGNLFVGGLFSSIGGASRRGVARLAPATGLATAWDIGQIAQDVRAMAIGNGALYIGGYFLFIQGQPRRNIAAVDLQTATLLPFAPEPYDSQDAFYDVASIVVQDTVVHFGGHFDLVNGGVLSRKFMASAYHGSGTISPWDPRPDNYVLAMTISEGRLYVGGGFYQVAERIRQSFAVFTLCIPQTFYADLDGDGYGNPSASIAACAAPPDHVTNAGDCDDSDAAIFVGAACDDGDPHTTLDSYGAGCACAGSSLRVEAGIFLQGPYEGGSMGDLLRVGGWLPLGEPYSGLGFVHTASGGGETINASVLNTTGPDAIVDWVVLSLRSADALTVDLGSRSALVQRDGDVVDLDGASPVRFPLPAGAYHVVVRHRNHLGIMSALPVALTDQAAMVDFRNGDVPTYGLEAQIVMGSDRLLWSGDVTHDGVLKYTTFQNDRDPILVAVGGDTPNNIIAGYLSTDVNLDGLVKYTGTNNDRNQILVNLSGTEPNVTRTAQLP